MMPSVIIGRRRRQSAAIAAVPAALLLAASPLSAQPPSPAAPPYSAGQEFQAQAGGQNSRSLGEIEEQSPLLPPPQRQEQKGAAPFTPMIPPLQLMPARPQPAPAVTLGDYPLDAALLTRLEKIHAEILKLPELDDDNNDDDISGGVDVLVTAMERRPDIMGVLGRNLISARDYIFAMQALSYALSAASGAEEAQVFGENSKISAENLAFGKKYADRIRHLLEE